MTSWRDTASAEAQNDLDGLVNATLPFAQKFVKEHGEFYPFAARVATDGEIHLLAGAPEGSTRPPSADVIGVLYDGLRDLAEQSRAVAVVSDVRISPELDAIRVDVEHREAIAIAVLLPYSARRFGTGVEFGDLQAGAAERRVWP